MIDNTTIADVLDDIGNLFEIEESGSFRVRAYRNAADFIRFFDPPLAEMVAAGENLSKLEGIGSGIAKRIGEIVADGPDAYRAKLEAEHGPGLLDLLRIPGLGPKRVKSLRDVLAIRSLDDLREALESGRLREVSGFGPKSVEQLRRRLERISEREAEREH